MSLPQPVVSCPSLSVTPSTGTSLLSCLSPIRPGIRHFHFLPLSSLPFSLHSCSRPSFFPPAVLQLLLQPFSYRARRTPCQPRPSIGLGSSYAHARTAEPPCASLQNFCSSSCPCLFLCLVHISSSGHHRKFHFHDPPLARHVHANHLRRPALRLEASSMMPGDCIAHAPSRIRLQ